jgi:hypothetical protein
MAKALMNRGYTAIDENTGVILLFHRSRADGVVAKIGVAVADENFVVSFFCDEKEYRVPHPQLARL